ncbi:hypothetical protein BEI02_12530 [Elizabethkingia sp. HvH-WGS333]|uniref:YXWGXW repeat-containing protein n=1 Tax=Elizabethkingia TaxID=308865 RepID=UPI0007416D68|nr:MULTISPECIES: YXWGXW repeat-containing protein [Elizabethkingia]MCL1655156.1 YXWGXW repeat-containing protein [Elizabethkingia miricola]MCP1252055.1 YXWGXW repeat-containing protein [Elizabethkingia sp. S0634]OIK47366.1 hypothetical protein BEI02_12530 [Elizabethkingia sp. HvH-WGS333]
MKAKRLAYILSIVSLLTLGTQAKAQLSVSINIAPPPIPTYAQPMPPADGYIWIPGYWAYDQYSGYYWVPGYWTMPPSIGMLWTPGYWGFNNGLYAWHRGYWGPRVGFYGGINYGFGYFGTGFSGGMWRGNTYVYNTAVTRVNTNIHNTYIDNHYVNNTNRISYNGRGGVNMTPDHNDRQYMREQRNNSVPTDDQRSHNQAARNNPDMRFERNNGTLNQDMLNRYNDQMKDFRNQQQGHNMQMPRADRNNFREPRMAGMHQPHMQRGGGEGGRRR